MKPIATLMKQLQSVDLSNNQTAPAFAERSDVCAVPAASVIGEAMVAIVLAQALQQKFGGDSLQEMQTNFAAYQATYAGKTSAPSSYQSADETESSSTA